MKAAKHTPQITWSTTLTLTEDESRALDAVTGYSTSAFLDVLYEKMGRAYLQPYARGWETFVEAVRSQVVPQLHQIDEARRVLRGERVAQHERAGAAAALGLIGMGQAIAASLSVSQAEEK